MASWPRWPACGIWFRFDSVLRWYVAVAHGVVLELMPTSFHCVLFFDLSLFVSDLCE